MILYFNPFEELIKIFDEIRKVDFDIIIEWSNSEQLEKEAGEPVQGITVFPDDNGPIVILVNGEIPLTAMCEILGHEFSHVLAGSAAGHNERWEYYFEIIHEKFIQKVEEFHHIVCDAELNFRKLMTGRLKKIDL